MQILKFLSTNTNTPMYNSQNVSSPRFGLRLQPQLQCDTVNFTSKKERDSYLGIPLSTAKLVNIEAAKMQPDVDKFVDSLFADLIATPKKPKNPIAYIKGRVKSPLSIKEKCETLEITSKEEALNTLTDLNGKKVVFRDARHNEVDKVLNKLKTAIQNGEVELLEIENKRPIATKGMRGPNATQYDYASRDTLVDLIKTQKEYNESHNQKYAKKHKKIKYEPDDYTKVNYCALHMLLRLPGEKRPFELTFMGVDVDKLKNLDDKLFKILNNKEVDKKYDKLTKIVKKLKKPENAEWLEKFNKYRGEAFLYQRTKEPNSYTFKDKRKTPNYFLPLMYDIPPIYDLNKLQEIMEECER